MISPKNIHCLALNYKGVGDIKEIPLYFVKSLSALCFSGAKVRYPSGTESLWTEVELTIVVKEDCYQVSEEDAHNFIEGYIVGADLTCKNLYTRDHHLGFSKSRENFCPVSSDLVSLSRSEVKDLELFTEINGKITQQGNINEMKLDPFQSFSFVSGITSLKKGDIILTGTPKGVENNIVKRGDEIVQYIPGIGRIEYSVGE